jgi:signal peptidase I
MAMQSDAQQPPVQQQDFGAPGTSHKRSLRAKLLVGLAVPVGLLILLVIAAVGAGFLRTYRIPSPAMSPTLQVGDHILVAKAQFPFSDLHRGDVITFHPPSGADTQQCGQPQSPTDGHPCPRPTPGQSRVTFIKRIVGVPGDSLSIRNNRVYVNGTALDEPFIKSGTPCGELCNLPKPIKIEPGYYYVLGDNRGESDDSRDWGPVPSKSIIGRKIFSY